MKLCVPVTGKSIEEINLQLDELALLDFDMIEWRADYFLLGEAFDIIKQSLFGEALDIIKQSFPDKELIFTIRTKAEGGECQPEVELMMAVLKNIAFSGRVDIVDLELEGICKTNPGIIGELKLSGVKLMISSHDFEKTPSKEDIINRYEKMEAVGADIAKIAVMPKRESDVEVLISAAKEAGTKIKIPLVAISMGEMGIATRIYGEEFGSTITFGAIGKGSAPGQIPARELKEKLIELRN